MDDAAQPHARRAFRAEFILAPAIIAMCLAIAALLLLLWRAERIQAEEGAIVARSRAVRTELIAASQAQGDAETMASRYLATRRDALLRESLVAQEHARMHLLAGGVADNDAEIAAKLAHLSDLVEQRFSILNAEIRSGRPMPAALEPESYFAFRNERAAVFALLDARIDAARRQQEGVRRQLYILSAMLAVVSLFAASLAIFALRSERKQWRLAHAAAEEARAKAAASDLSKTRFLAVASHDMRQPLHALMLYVSALQKRVETAEARDILSKMDRATRSMAGMFSTLLDLARIQSGVIAPEIVDFPLQEVIDRIAAESAEGALEAPATSWFIRSDPALIERVLRNLVGNAIKHGGGKARIELIKRGSELEIAIADDGRGVADEDKERIFDEFVRLDGKGEGLGLGLAIVKRIGELLDTPIKIESKPGHGARFSLCVPLAAAAPTAIAPLAETQEVFRQLPTLVVDDELLAREAVAGVLRDLGARVRSCANEAEADALLSEGFAPALIVMDYRIDGELRGLDAARRLHAKLAQPPVVIVVTGDTEQGTLAALRESGFAWLIKPVDARTLIDAVARQLRAEPISAT